MQALDGMLYLLSICGYVCGENFLAIWSLDQETVICFEITKKLSSCDVYKEKKKNIVEYTL